MPTAQIFRVLPIKPLVFQFLSKSTQSRQHMVFDTEGFHLNLKRRELNVKLC